MPFRELASFKTPRRIAVSQVVQMANNPPPTGGLNLRDPISAMSPLDAVVLNNFIPRQQGVEIRKGWRYSSTAVENGNFKSVFAYNAASTANNKLFAASAGVIYDVTTSTPSVAAAATGSTTGIWWTTQFTTSSGTYLLAVSPGAGYWTYDSTNGWVNRTSLTNGLPSTVRTVAVWKRRIWFTSETGGQAHYMRTVDAIQGHADEFPMGSILNHGGSLSAMMNWTLDAGYGIDDYLVVVGTQGDVGIWRGTDPSSIQTFELTGVWYIGPVPAYGTYFTAFGGDVMILSEQGLVPMSKVIAGQWNEAALNNAPASKIQTTLNPLVNQYRNTQSWDVTVIPGESLLIIKCPLDSFGQYIQFVMNTITGAWSTFSGIPMNSATVLNGALYFGTTGGRVARALLGNKDGEAIDASGGSDIECDVQQAFNDYQSPANLKRFQLARPIFLAANAPSVLLQINTQYGTSTPPGAPSFTVPSGSIWNTSNWNQAYWIGATNTYQAWVGLVGLGYYGSIVMKVRGTPGTLLTSCHVMFEPGGVM